MPAPMLSPGTLPLGRALDDSVPLALLLARVQDANRRLAAVRALLPGELHDGVRAGPLDDTGWVLLAEGNAAAAKLRQLLPRLQHQMLADGFTNLPIRVKVQPRA